MEYSPETGAEGSGSQILVSNFSGHQNLLGNFFKIRFLGLSLQQKSLNVLEHLYFDKAQTADLGPLENLERLRNPPCLSAVPK